MTRSNDKGIALVFTLFLMGSMSALAVSLMFLSQTETSSTRNYRTMSQARYAGEAGAHKAINYMLNSYTEPGSGSDPLSNYVLTASPVTYNGQPVVLSALSAVPSNYPDSAKVSAFNSAAQGTLAVGTGTVTYGASATLLSMRQATVYGGGTGVIQTWEVTATGTVPGALPATVNVTAVLERNLVAAETYGIFATGTGCGAITMSGNVRTDSYDSTSPTSMATTPPTVNVSGGSVGTNGNLTISGNVTVNGNLDTPRTGVGSCNAGTPAALTGSGTAAVTGAVVQLPQAKTFTTPNPPSPLPPTTAVTINSSTLCASLGISLPAVCTGLAGNLTITANGATLSLGNISMSGGAALTIAGGTSSTVNMDVNSMSLSGNSTLTLATGTSLVLNVAGVGQATPLDFSGGTFANSSFDPSKFQILYGGTGAIKMTGGSGAAGTIYAPNAAVTMSGSADFYGSILSNMFTDSGGAKVHYDRSLQSKFFTLGNYVMTSFSWKKY